MNENIELIEFNKRKKYLKRYRKVLTKIDRLQSKLEDLNERMYKIKSPNFSGMPKGGTPPTLAEMLSDKEELESRIEKQIQKSKIIKKEILSVIDDLENDLQSEVLEGFFIEGRTLEDIAEDQGYTVRYIAKVYSVGITNIDMPVVHF